MYSNWERLGNILAAVNHLQKVKVQVARSMHTNYQGSTHKQADTSALVWRIANKAWDLDLQDHNKNQHNQNTSTRRVPDLRSLGQDKFASSSLATFNKKVQDLIAGYAVEEEADEMTPVSLEVGEDGEIEDNIIDNDSDSED